MDENNANAADQNTPDTTEESKANAAEKAEPATRRRGKGSDDSAEQSETGYLAGGEVPVNAPGTEGMAREQS